MTARPPHDPTIRPCTPRRGHYLALFAVCAAFAIYGSLLPFRFESLEFGRAVSLFADQLKSPSLRPSRIDFTTNVLLFVPLGFAGLAVALLDQYSKSRLVLSLLGVVVACTALSFGVEFAQVWVPGRTASRLDILAQLLGTLIGAGAWIVGGQQLTTWLRTWQSEGATASSISRLLLLYTLGYCAYNLLPLDLAVHPGEIARKFTRGRILLVPFSGYEWNLATYWGLLFDVLLCIPIGAWCSGVGTVRRRSLLDAVLLGALIVLALECAQILVVSRFSETTDVLTGTLGVAIGAYLAQTLSTRATAQQRPAALTLRWLSLAIVLAAFAIVYSWAPFDWIEDAHTIRDRLRDFVRLPFSTLRDSSDFLALSKILRDCLLFLPIGACLTLALLSSRLKHRPRLCATLSVGLAAGLGLVIELGQAALAGQTSDLTDVILYTFGAAAGVFLALVPARRYSASPVSPQIGVGDPLKVEKLRQNQRRSERKFN